MKQCGNAVEPEALVYRQPEAVKNKMSVDITGKRSTSSIGNDEENEPPQAKKRYRVDQ